MFAKINVLKVPLACPNVIRGSLGGKKVLIKSIKFLLLNFWKFLFGKFSIFAFSPTMWNRNFVPFQRLRFMQKLGKSDAWFLKKIQTSRLTGCRIQTDFLENKLSKYTDLNHQNLVSGGPLNARIMEWPRKTTNFYVKGYWGIILNAKLGKSRT